MFRLFLMHVLKEIVCTDNLPTSCLCATNAVNKKTLYSWISDLNVLQPHFLTQNFKYLIMFHTQHSWFIFRGPNPNKRFIVGGYIPLSTYFIKNAHTHHIHMNLADPIAEPFGPTALELANIDDLPLDSQVISKK